MAGYQSKSPTNPTSDWVWWIAASRKVIHVSFFVGVKPTLIRVTHSQPCVAHAAPLLARHDSGLMSALGSKADITACLRDVRFAPKPTLTPPKILKAGRRKLSVSNCVLYVAVAQISLQRSRVVPVVRQRVTASVPEHVWMSLEAKPSFSACALNHAGKASGREGCAPLRSEYERRLGLLLTLEAPQGA
jgi:hypothetical protein